MAQYMYGLRWCLFYRVQSFRRFSVVLLIYRTLFSTVIPNTDLTTPRVRCGALR